MWLNSSTKPLRHTKSPQFELVIVIHKNLKKGRKRAISHRVTSSVLSINQWYNSLHLGTTLNNTQHSYTWPVSLKVGIVCSVYHWTHWSITTHKTSLWRISAIINIMFLSTVTCRLKLPAILEQRWPSNYLYVRLCGDFVSYLKPQRPFSPFATRPFVKFR